MDNNLIAVLLLACFSALACKPRQALPSASLSESRADATRVDSISGSVVVISSGFHRNRRRVRVDGDLIQITLEVARPLPAKEIDTLWHRMLEALERIGINEGLNKKQ